VAAGIVTFVWPDITLYVVSIFVAWYLIVFGVMHLVSALAGPKPAWWWTQLLPGSPSWCWASGRRAPGSGRCSRW
jgi:uncharacterized membrane protein HdeD (DUF308 family)